MQKRQLRLPFFLLTQWCITGYFKDPDCYLFEVGYEKIWVFDDKHYLVIDEIKERTC